MKAKGRNMKKASRRLVLIPALWIFAGMSLNATITIVNRAHAENDNSLFKKYRVARIYKGRGASVNLRSHKNARMFRTQLRRAARNRPNFAGRIIIASWGCGTSCQVIALINARTGKVSFGPTASVGFEHRLSSRLLIVNPAKSITEVHGSKSPSWLKTKYYLWKKGRLILLRNP